MIVSRSKNTIVYLFLFLFLSLTMVGLHTFMHAEDDDHATACAVCEHAITQNLTPFISPQDKELVIAKIQINVIKETRIAYSYLVSYCIATNQLFSRPPPATT